MSGSGDSLPDCSSLDVSSCHSERFQVLATGLEARETQELVQQLSVLKAQVATVHSKLQDNEDLIQAKHEENHELSEKLRALELAIQCLNDTSKSSGLGCCSSACRTF